MPDKGSFSQPDDLAVVRTPDGSATLDSRHIREHYHSLHGAATESRYVYIEKGLLHLEKNKVDILEVGLGTGLNALLTWDACRQGGMEVRYTALEPFPLAENLWHPLDHPRAIGKPELAADYRSLMTALPGQAVNLSEHFTFRWLPLMVQELESNLAYDVVFYDAFAPHAQPAMWTVDVFRRVHRAMRLGGVLVTYCAKGDVRRAMLEVGLDVERLPGPPGKREMLRATRPA